MADTLVMGTPRVSVCIPTYNMGSFLLQSVGSVLAQSYSDYEIIISDNNSNDDTRDVVSQFQDRRIRYHVNPATVSMYANFNTALGYARGEFTKFLCADDVLYPRYLDEAVSLFERVPQVGVVAAATSDAGRSGRLLRRQAKASRSGSCIKRADIIRIIALTGETGFASPSHLMYRTCIFRELGKYDERLLYADYDHYLRILGKYCLGWIAEPLLEKRYHAKAASYEWKSKVRQLDEMFEILRSGLVGISPFNMEWIARNRILLRTAEQVFWYAVKSYARKERKVLSAVLSCLCKRRYILPAACYILLCSPFFLVGKVRRFLLQKERGGEAVR